MAGDQLLRSEIRRLGELLGDTLREQAGKPALELVEEIRALAKARRRGNREAERKLADRIAALGARQIAALTQALSVFFDLANLAEERHRVRVIRERARRGSKPGIERVQDVALLLKQRGVSARRIADLLEQLSIEFVFTAHPTEAKRRSIREKVRDLREHLEDLDHGDLLPRERDELTQRVRADLAGIWQTDFVRFRRPSVLEELDRSLFFAGNLWSVTPRLYRDLQQALRQHFPQTQWRIPPLFRFGTWIGGDRDGNPNVTAAVTAKALMSLRREAMSRHVEQARITRRKLSMSSAKAGVSEELIGALDAAVERWPSAAQQIAHLSETEPYRRWLKVVQWRLERASESALTGNVTGELPAGAYENAREFIDDLQLMQRSLSAHRGQAIAEAHLDDWLCQARVFGFHLMTLDVRQESSWYHRALAELLAQRGIDDYANMNEAARQEALTRTMASHEPFDESRLSEPTRETLALFRLLASVCAKSGPESLGAHIISMTHHPSDVLAALWFARWAAAEQRLPGGGGAALPMPIAPLFETIDDLRRSAQTLNEILQHPAYAPHVKALGNRQVVMIGYSDSTKDGGYLAACWELYAAQQRMQRVAEASGVQIVFFHGRGGSLGRGGGPAARSIVSLPPGTLAAGLRMTEQGEVLAERYDDPDIAHRHLEQVVTATIACAAGALTQTMIDDHDRELLEAMAGRARAVYRELVEQPGFIDYFEQATPITQIEQLPIGSRPARRRGERSLATLRAIPWVFSWTQCRHMIPAWYGLGAAIEWAMTQAKGGPRLGELYAKNQFFRAMIDNAALALAKADLGIARLHAGLAEDETTRLAIWSRISSEYANTRKAVLKLTGKRQLLADIPWLKRSIEVRNPYVDPLNFIQVELFKRLRDLDEDDSRARDIEALIRLTIQGIAGGLRTTG